jgi:hypothetical protein
MGTGAVSPEVKLPERKADHAPPSSVEANNTTRVVATQVPHTSSWLGT